MIRQYKCPNCGTNMAFESNSGMLACHSCDREEKIENFPKEFVTQTFQEDETNEYGCENCGATLITNKDTVATICGFCGAGIVLENRVAGYLAPSKVIPFVISKDEAKVAFRKWCRNGLLTPKGFASENRIRNITGMYVPFWLYDVNSKVKVTATGTTASTYTMGDYSYTDTKYYDIYRDVDLNYIKVPADASEKMNDALMDRLEPYDYSQLKDFNTPYLAGYLAEKYNYDSEQLLPRITQRIKNFSDAYMRSTVSKYGAVSISNKQIEINQQDVYYALLPVWTLVYKYDKSESTFTMNGQTGKIVGTPPICPSKIASWFSGISIGTFAILKIIALIMGGSLW